MSALKPMATSGIVSAWRRLLLLEPSFVGFRERMSKSTRKASWSAKMGKIVMTSQHIKLILTSFASVRSITDTAALFYGRLFELDLSLRCLFHGNMRAQGRKLMAMLW